jgi:hypothetical protein
LRLVDKQVLNLISERPRKPERRIRKARIRRDEEVGKLGKGWVIRGNRIRSWAKDDPKKETSQNLMWPQNFL